MQKTNGEQMSVEEVIDVFRQAFLPVERRGPWRARHPVPHQDEIMAQMLDMAAGGQGCSNEGNEVRSSYPEFKDADFRKICEELGWARKPVNGVYWFVEGPGPKYNDLDVRGDEDRQKRMLVPVRKPCSPEDAIDIAVWGNESWRLGHCDGLYRVYMPRKLCSAGEFLGYCPDSALDPQPGMVLVYSGKSSL